MYFLPKQCGILHSQSIYHTSSAIVLVIAGLLYNKNTHTQRQKNKRMWLEKYLLFLIEITWSFPNVRIGKHSSKNYPSSALNDDIIFKYNELLQKL